MGAMEMAPNEPTSNLCHAFTMMIPPKQGDGAEQPAAVDEDIISALQDALKLREQGERDSMFAEGWPAELEAHSRHLLGKLLASNPKEPAENPRLWLAHEHFKAAAALVPTHQPYKTSLNELYTAMIKRQEALGTADAQMNAEVERATGKASSVPIVDLN